MKNKKNNTFWKKWQTKYNFVISNSDTFEERFSFRFSRLNVASLIVFLFLFLVGGTSLIIGLTPLKEYIPGYTSTNMRRQVVALNHLSDSLLVEINKKDIYLENIKNIIDGRVFNEVGEDSLGKIDVSEISFVKNTEDSLLRNLVESEERFNVFYSEKKNQPSITDLLFFNPINGVVSQGFNSESNHFGVDVVAKKNEAIKAVLDGVVVFSSWTSETGYVIVLLHENNLLSVYKHNSVLLKKEGVQVVAGEVIAIVGNSGEFSSGPHLHFEIWHNGRAVDPQEYIVF